MHNGPMSQRPSVSRNQPGKRSGVIVIIGQGHKHPKNVEVASPSAQRSMHLLIVETDSQFLAEIKQALEQAGYEVAVANDGMAGWTYLTGARPPDLLVTRIHLGSGVPPGTALGLQAQSQRPAIPVIYIPATAELASLADPEHGAVLLKPFLVATLVETVRKLLEADSQGQD